MIVVAVDVGRGRYGHSLYVAVVTAAAVRRRRGTSGADTDVAASDGDDAVVTSGH